MYKSGIIVGRFQPFHKGHLSYLKKALSHAEKVYIGITTPGKKLTKYEPKDPNRLGKENNPYTFLERKTMIKKSLKENKINPRRIRILHFNPGKIDYWFKSVPEDAVYFLILISNEEGTKVEEMRKQGLKVKVLDVINKDRYSAYNIRGRIKKGQPWKNLVDKAVGEYIEDLKKSVN